MQCRQCGGKWETPPGFPELKNCPFCGAALEVPLPKPGRTRRVYYIFEHRTAPTFRVLPVCGQEVRTDATELTFCDYGLLDEDAGKLSECVRLKKLDLRGNFITELGFLSGMTELEFLDVGWNPLKNVDALGTLSTLRGVGLGGIQGLDLAALKELQGLRALCAYGMGLTEKQLEAIGSLTRLECLDISANENVELRQLSSLECLNELDLNYNVRPDLQSLVQTAELTALSVVGCGLTDETRYVGSFSKLRRLNVSNNERINLTYLGKLTQLEELQADHCGLSEADIPVFSRFQKLMRLSLANNRIYDVRPLTDLGKLRELNLSGCWLTDEDVKLLLWEFPLLEKLSLAGNNLTDISPLCCLKNLTELDIGWTYCKNLYSLAGLGKLKKLVVTGCEVSDTRVLTELTELEKLEAFYCGIRDLEPIAGLWNLTALCLCGGNPIQDFSPLRRMTRLKELCIDNMGFQDIAPLGALTGLTFLNLSNNPISGLSAMAGLQGLKVLYLDGTQVADVSPLAELENLSLLAMDRCQIKDFTPLKGLRHLKELRLRGTGITESQLNSLRSALPLCDIKV